MPTIGQNNIIRMQTYSTGYNTFQSSSSQAWTTLTIGQTNYTGSRLSGNTNICEFEKKHNNSHLKIVANFPGYHANGASGFGYRLVISKDNSTYYTDVIDNGPADRWGAMGYGGATAGIWRFEWDTEAIDATRSSGFLTHTGTFYFYFQWANWNSSDTSYPLTYSVDYPKYGTIVCKEYLD